MEDCQSAAHPCISPSQKAPHLPFLRLFVLALTLFLSANVFAQTSTPPLAVEVTKDVLYTTDNTGSYRGDLYAPSGPGPFPAVVMIHGGSWQSGHKTELRRLAADFAAHGYVCFSIDYDTHPRSFPYSWQESRAAVIFLRDHAAAYRIDPGRIAALGTSAGGQLAALLAVAPEGPVPVSPTTADASATNSAAVPQTPTTMAPRPLATVPVAAAVLFNGGYNAHVESYFLRRYLGGRCRTIPAVCNDASPDFHVRPGAPPIFVGHGLKDGVIPYSQATTFIDLLRAAGNPVTPFAATGAGHSYWRSHKWYEANLAAAEAFLAAAMPQP